MKKKIFIAVLTVLFLFLTHVPLEVEAQGANYDRVALNAMTNHRNGSTNWQVAYRFQYQNDSGAPVWMPVWHQWTNRVSGCRIVDVPGGAYTASWCNHLLNAADGYRVYTPSTSPNSRRMNRPFRVQWGTTCIDPVQSPNSQGSHSTGGGTGYFAIFKISVTFPYQAGNDGRAGGGGANNTGRNIGYAYGNVINNNTSACPFPCRAPSCSGRCGTFRDNCGYGITSPQVSCGGCGSNYCGSGSNRCDVMDRYCTSSNRCASRVAVNLSSTCVGQNNCCLNNSQCHSNHSPPRNRFFCGTGSRAEVCTRYERFCNGSNACAVRSSSSNTAADWCINNTNRACRNDGQCNSNYFCRTGGNYCGICQEFDQINGRVFVDVDRNNNWTSGTDIPLGGATVQRSPRGANNWSSSTATSGNGQYSFSNLRNPGNQDVRIRPIEFGLYDANHCTYTNIIRSRYQGNIQTSPGHRRNNVDPTPTLSGLHFMLRTKPRAILGKVYVDGDNSGTISAGDWGLNNSNVRVRVNHAPPNGAWIANDNLYSGADTARRGNYFINDPEIYHGQNYTVSLATGTLPSTLFPVAPTTRPVSINCANNGGNNFLVTRTPQPLFPDLGIETFTIPSGNVGQTVTGTITFTNYGAEPTSSGFTVVVNHGSGTATFTESALAANGSRTRNFSVTLPAAETYDISADAFVDSTNAVNNESDETNNTALTSYEALPVGVTPGPTPPPPSVDLEIISFTVDDGIPGNQTPGDIEIINSGTSDITGTFNINVTNGAGGSTNFSAGPLDAGESTPISFNLTTPATSGTFTATATVDSANVVAESDETNNTAITTYQAIDLPDIQGGVYIDGVDSSNISDGIKSPGEDYTTGRITISDGVGTFNSANPGGFLAQDVPIQSYTISLNTADIPPGWQALDLTGAPLLTPPDPIFILVFPGGACDTGSHIHALCDADGNITGIDFPIRQIPASPWFNGLGGDMRSDDPLENRIPETANTFFSDIGGNSSAGIVFGDDLTLNPLTTNATNITNPNNWLVEKDFQGVIKTSYASVLENLKKGGNLPSSTLPGGNVNPSDVSSLGVYSYSGDITLTGGDFNFTGAGNSYVILVNGDLRIENNISVAQGSTAIFIVNGDINIAQNVDNIAGIFSADQTFTVEGVGDGSGDADLTIQGSVIGLGGSGFENERDLLALNEINPAVQIIYRPDFVLYAPELIKFSNYTIREVAPGAE